VPSSLDHPPEAADPGSLEPRCRSTIVGPASSFFLNNFPTLATGHPAIPCSRYDLRRGDPYRLQASCDCRTDDLIPFQFILPILRKAGLLFQISHLTRPVLALELFFEGPLTLSLLFRPSSLFSTGSAGTSWIGDPSSIPKYDQPRKTCDGEHGERAGLISPPLFFPFLIHMA